MAVGKLVHYSLLLAIPLALHGPAATLPAAAAYAVTQSIVLAATFAVSHNVPESKPLDNGELSRWLQAAGCRLCWAAKCIPGRQAAMGAAGIRLLEAVSVRAPGPLPTPALPPFPHPPALQAPPPTT